MERLVAITALFLSGFAGLAYEVCWIRQASLVFGSSTFAMSTVLAAFFLGLAGGSYLFGRVAERSAHPLRLYALLEIGLGLLAIASPLAFDLADSLYGQVYRAFDERSILLFGSRLALVSLIVLPPTFLMGGTLPLFCRQYVRKASHVARPVGFLYGVNTLGAMVGCACTGLILLPEIGVQASVRLGALLSLIAGVSVWALSRTVAEPAPAPAPRRQQPAPRAPFVVALLFFLAGFVALGSQVLWTRYLALFVRNTVFAYTITLTVVLAGIVVGSWMAARIFDGRLPRALCFGALQVGSGLALIGLMMLSARFAGAFQDNPTVLLLLLLPPAVLSGASLPLAVRMVVEDASLAARGTGEMFAVNTLGGITGSLTLGFAGLPLAGLHASLLGISGLSLASGFAAWWWLDRFRPLRGRAIATAGALLAWIAIPFAAGVDLPATLLVDAGEELVDYREGLTANVAVIRADRNLLLEIDRQWQGTDQQNQQRMAAHIPMHLHPSPRRVLVVGVGAGQTPGRFLFYDVDHVDCVDIEPAIFDLVRDHYDASWMEDARVSLIQEDGRNFIAHADREYDLISLELGQTFRPGVASFYSSDFYHRVRHRLRPGGLASQFVPLQFLGVDEFRSVVRSFLDVFPQTLLWYNTTELLLIGVKADRWELARERFQQLRARDRIAEDLAYSYWGGPRYRLNRPLVFLGGFLMGPRGLAALAGGAKPYRDDHPKLEYAVARPTDDKENELANLALLRQHLEPVGPLLSFPLSQEEDESVREIRDRNLGDIRASALLRAINERELPTGKGAEQLRVALEANPDRAETHWRLGNALLRMGRPVEAEKHFRAALEAKPDSSIAQLGLALALHRSGRVPASLPHYRAALEFRPGDVQILNHLGGALAQLGDLRAAARRFEEVLRIQPDDPQAKKQLARVRARQAGRQR
jgi:spermidine synthase